MIYSKAKIKDHKRPSKRKRREYKPGDFIFYYNKFDRDRINSTYIESFLYDSPIYYFCRDSVYAPAYHVDKKVIIGKISPKNKLLRLVYA